MKRSILAMLVVLPLAQLCAAEEMQARSRNYMLNRGTLSMDALLKSPDLTATQVGEVDLLLRELRSQMQLFMDSSGLEGEALQGKLQDLLEVTRYKVGVITASAGK
jgi:hypothetical protein